MKINIEIDTRNSEDKEFLSSLKDTVLEFLLQGYTDDDEDDDEEDDEEEDDEEDDELVVDRCVFFNGPTPPPIESSVTSLRWALEGYDALVLVDTQVGYAAITDVGASMYDFLKAPGKVILDGWLNPRWYTVQPNISHEDAVVKYGEEAVAAFTSSTAKLVQITVGSDTDDDDE